MKSKTLTRYIYEGLGFPIELHNVTMVKIDDEWHPKLNVKHIAENAVKSLITQKERLTGNQIKFIRSYFSMTLREFAKKVVNESHTAVSKWEKCGDNVTNMDINIEKILRLYAYDRLFVKTNKQKTEFYKIYQLLSELTSSNTGVHLLSVA